jgi:hypothetical protein
MGDRVKQRSWPEVADEWKIIVLSAVKIRRKRGQNQNDEIRIPACRMLQDEGARCLDFPRQRLIVSPALIHVGLFLYLIW